MFMHSQRKLHLARTLGPEQTRAMNPTVLARYSKEMEGKLDDARTPVITGSTSRTKKIAAGISILAAPAAIKFWHQAVIYAAYEMFLPDRPIGKIFKSVFGNETLENLGDLAKNNFGSMEDVLAFGLPILTAATLAGFASKLLKKGGQFKSDILEKTLKKRVEITVGAITAVGVLSEIFPIFTKNGLIVDLTLQAYETLSRILPIGEVMPAFASNVRDVLDIPFVLIGGAVAYLIFKPAQYFLDSIASAKNKLQS